MAIYTSSIITPHSPSPASSSSSSCLLRACRFRTFSSGTSPFHSLNKWTQTPSSSSSSSSPTSRLQQRHGGSCCSSIGPRSSSSSSSPWMMRMTTPSLQFSLRKETIGVPTSRRSRSRIMRRSRGGGGLVTTAALATPLITATNTWGTWTVLLASAAFGLWSEQTKWGSALSGALVSTLVGLVASNVGLIASEAPAYAIVNGYLLPLAVPLLLFAADMRRVMASTGRLFTAFCIGSVATVLGTLVAMVLVPLRSLGPDGWKIASALLSRHIGGGGLVGYAAVNYVAVTEALGASPSIVAAGLAADNLICAVYFTTLFALASGIPPDPPSTLTSGSVESTDGSSRGTIKVLDGIMALALSAAICAAGAALAKANGLKGGTIPCVTAIVVFLATLFPTWVGALAPSGEGLAVILMQIFFTTVGANGSIGSVITTAPALFLFSLVQIAVHLGFILGVGKLLKFDMRELLLASNANVGGPTTAAGMCTAKGWRTLVVPAVLIGIFGIAIATFLAIALGVAVLSKM